MVHGGLNANHRLQGRRVVCLGSNQNKECLAKKRQHSHLNSEHGLQQTAFRCLEYRCTCVGPMHSRDK